MAIEKNLDDDKDLDLDEGAEDENEGGEDVTIDDDEDEGKEGKDKDGKDKGDDERLGADPDAETEEQRRARKREERKAKRLRKKEYDRRDRTELNFLRQRNEDLEKRQNAIEKTVNTKLTAVGLAQIDTNIRTLKGRLAEVDEVIAAGVEAGDGSEIAKANQLRDDIRDRIAEQMAIRRVHKEAAEEGGADDGDDRGRDKGNGRQEERKPEDVARSNARIFATRHSDWFDGNNADSKVAVKLDRKLRAEGFNPATADFWNELEDRLKDELPHRFEGKDDDDSDDDDDDLDERDTGRREARGKPNGEGKEAVGKKPAGGPRNPAPGGANGSAIPKGRVYHVSKDRKEAMIAAGMWDDPVLRNKMIKKYAKWDKENPAGSRN
jgi:hypothetical protein